jgi:hypothetical protein
MQSRRPHIRFPRRRDKADYANKAITDYDNKEASTMTSAPPQPPQPPQPDPNPPQPPEPQEPEAPDEPEDEGDEVPEPEPKPSA